MAECWQQKVSFRCLAPIHANGWLANSQHFLQFHKTLDANIVSRSSVLLNALSSSSEVDGATLVLPTGTRPSFFDAWAQLTSSEAQYKMVSAFSVPELLDGLKVR
jgi:hypothetical protein